uniref:Ceramide synthase 6 n=1 Tax=Lygus hesperus TaxID=30085 RepID=A0A0A9YLB5_LYGHE
MSIAAGCLLYNQTWLSKPWSTHRSPPTYEYTPSTAQIVFYILQLAIAIYTGYSHRFNRTSHDHKDYTCMYLHHLITITLLLLSFVTGHLRIGIPVLFLHDFSDIFIDTVKLTSYLNVYGAQHYYVSEIVYCTLLVVWIHTRLYLLPKLIYYGIYTLYSTNPDWIVEGAQTYGRIMLMQFGPHSYEYRWHRFVATFLCLFITSLVFLHVWWTILLLRIATRITTSRPSDAASVYDENTDTVQGVSHED